MNLEPGANSSRERYPQISVLLTSPGPPGLNQRPQLFRGFRLPAPPVAIQN